MAHHQQQAPPPQENQTATRQHEHEHVAQAALAMVRPHTDAQSRAAASAFLEEWTRTPESWPVFSLWLHESSSSSFLQTTTCTLQHVAPAAATSENSSSEAVGMLLLCLQLLQGKIRREVSSSTTSSGIILPHLERIQGELANLLSSSLASSAPASARPVLASASICLAALTVRMSAGGGLTPFVQQCLTAATQTENHNTMSPAVAFRLLSNIPVEVEAVTGKGESSSTSQQQQQPLVAELRTLVQNVLETSCRALASPQAQQQEDVCQFAMETLLHWTKTCRISLAHLNTPLTASTTTAAAHAVVTVLPLLIHILSCTNTSNERLIVLASRTLTESLLVPDDNVESAVQIMLQAVATSGFIAAPLQQATTSDWDDATHAVVTLLCTLVTEQVDECCCNNMNNSQYARPLMDLLLQVQSHPSINISCLPLECWLTIQEISVQERHEYCRKPLIAQVAQVLVQRLAYPSNTFTNWKDYDGATDDGNQHVDVEQSDFDEFRRLVNDVLISCYFLLRIDLVRSLTQLYLNGNGHGNNWREQEAALYALTVTSREVCARVKAHRAGDSGNSLAATTRIGQKDREETTRELLSLAIYVCTGGGGTNSSQTTIAAVEQTATKSLVLLAAVCTWLGAYAAAWVTHCSTQDILQMLAYLQGALAWRTGTTAAVHSQRCGYSDEVANVARAATTAIKIILTACASKLVVTVNSNSSSPTAEPSQQDVVLQAVHGIMEAALSSTDQEECVMTSVTEGCTRLLIQLQDEAAMQHSMSNLVMSVVQRGQAALAVIPVEEASLSEQAAVALEALGKYLQVLQVVFRFCETSSDSAASRTNIIASLMNAAWPFLETVTQRMARYEQVTEKVLSIHEQLLKNMPELIQPHFHSTIQYVMSIFEATKNPVTLDYMTTAVEVYGASTTDSSFQDLLNHLSGILFAYLSSNNGNIEECTDLIKAYFELNQRYILYCPTALVQCPMFSAIINSAIECLAACKGERESTRAVLNFLDRLYGWRSLHFPKQGSVADDSSINNTGDMIHSFAPQIDEQLAQHGARLLQCLMGILVSGPQMLGPACTDCIFSVVSWPAAANASSTVAQEWLERAVVSTTTAPNSHDNQKTEVYRLVVTSLLAMARAGPKSKGKAKMLLLDFSSVCKGESSLDELVRYNRV